MSSKSSVSKELRVGGDGYMDITRIPTIWGNQLQHRPKK